MKEPTIATVPDLSGFYIRLAGDGDTLWQEKFVQLDHHGALLCLAAFHEAVIPVSAARALAERLLRIADKHEAEAEAARRKAVLVAIDSLAPGGVHERTEAAAP